MKLCDDQIVRRGEGLQRRDSEKGRFTVKKQRQFLDALALTCNIGKSAAFAGVARTTVYRTRAMEPVFAGQWRDALAIGYDQLETLVLEHGGAGTPLSPDPDRAEAEGCEREPFDFDRAMKVLVYARGARNGEPNRRTGRPPKNATREETNAALTRALTAARRRVERTYR